MSFVETFGGLPVDPSTLGYASYEIDDDLTLVWPFEADAGADVLASQIEVEATDSGLSVYFPDATLASTGRGALVTNSGVETFNVRSNTGTSLASIASGETWYLYLTDNETQGGTWQVFQFGAGSSSANASALAGAGLVAAITRLNQNLPANPLIGNYAPGPNDRATVLRSTGGAVVYSPTSAATLTDGWFVYVINNGTGTLTWTPSGGELVDGSATKVLSPSESCIFFSDGADFWSLGYGRSVVSTVTSAVINVAGSADVTLTSNQVAAQIQNFTGALTGNIDVDYGVGPGYWFVRNATTGAYTLTLRVNNLDPGVVIAQNTFAVIRSDGTSMKVALTTTTGTVTQINTGTGLTGGPITTTGTIALANTAVSPGTYGDAATVPQFTVDAQGRLTAASALAISIAISQVQTFTSAQLLARVSDPQGTGSLVFATGPTLVNPVVGTQAPGNNTTLAASTAFVTAAVSALSSIYAPIASPTFTGTPAAPTAAPGTNTTQLATTAFVTAAITAAPFLGYHIFATGFWTGGTTYNSKNVASVGHPSTGVYNVTFTTPHSDANYIVLVTPVVPDTNRYYTIYSQSTTGFTLSTGGDNIGVQDVTGFSFIIFLTGNS